MLDEIAGKKELDWLPFSKGGSERWEVRVPSSELTRLTGEQVLLDMRRERTRNGIVSIHLFHATGEEYLPCDVFRRYVKLPACPESIRYDESSNEWVFKGIGEGHGFGLSVQGMAELERSGMTAAGIIEKAYLYGPDGRN
jgi:peptidoglycan hydrolase-like amidase